MSKYVIGSDEYYPFYDIDEPHEGYNSGVQREIPADKAEWVQKTLEEFERVQHYLAKLESQPSPKEESNGTK